MSSERTQRVEVSTTTDRSRGGNTRLRGQLCEAEPPYESFVDSEVLGEATRYTSLPNTATGTTERYIPRSRTSPEETRTGHATGRGECHRLAAMRVTASSASGRSSDSRLATASALLPMRIRLTGNSNFLPVAVFGIVSNS